MSAVGLAELLERLDRDPDERIAVCHEPPGGTFQPTLCTVADAATVAAKHANVSTWFSTQPLHNRVTTGRGTVADVIGLRELFADLDVKPGGLRDYDAARSVIADLANLLGSEPVAVVSTGHGFQPHWRVERGPGTDWPDVQHPAHGDAVALLRRWGRLVARVADIHGGSVDPVYDLVRVLRVPGTVNTKAEPKLTGIDLLAGTPVPLEQILECLDAYGVPELPEDRDLLGEVLAPVDGWTYATTTCSYVTSMTGGWGTDTPAKGRHPWLVSQATRLAAAHRLGCITQQGHAEAVDNLATRLNELLTFPPERAAHRREIADALTWGQAKVATFTDARTRHELGDHQHAPAASTIEDAAPVMPVLGEDAYQGLPGRVVKAIRPHTEAADAALLLTFLAAAGSLIDAGAYMFAGDAQHAARIWPLIIGKTAGGMKGTSANPILRLLKLAYPEFSMNIESGLSTGEGLIERVRDHTGEPDDKDFDEGVQDKRLLIIETEFGVVLGRARREGNVLSETLRAAWDGKTLSTMTRKSTKLRATGAHIVIVGHITPTELRAKLTESDVAGGLMNRFLPVHSHRSKRRPDGGSTPEDVLTELADELRDAVTAAWKVRRVERDEGAAQLWRDVYADLTPDDLPDGAYASVIARAAAQVVRISLIYALLDTHDGPVQIRTEHLKAALAVWEYVKGSAAAVFGDLSTGGALNKLIEAIDAAEDGLTRWQVADLFNRNKSKDEIDELIRRLLATGRYAATEDKTGSGRPTTRYRATKKTK